MKYNEYLENVALSLRKAFNINDDKIINSNNIEDIVNYIKSMDNYEVNYGYVNSLKLINNTYIIDISMDQIPEKQLDYLLIALCYSLIFDKSALNNSQLKNYVFRNVMYDDEANYIKDAFLMPRDLFLRSCIIHGTADNHIYIDDMEKEFGNKHVYKRGHDLGLF